MSSVIIVIWHKYDIMADLCHMSAMTDDIYDIFTKGLWVSMEAFSHQESGIRLKKTPKNCFQPKK